jgi:hypothetical protein
MDKEKIVEQQSCARWYNKYFGALALVVEPFDIHATARILSEAHRISG